MIDTSKQYTYNGKPVRIYADGSDCMHGMPHGAILHDDGTWYSYAFEEGDLVEVWEPAAGEWCFFWDNWHYLTVDKFKAFHVQDAAPFETAFGIRYINCAPFKGTLPDAFEGLK